MESAPINVIDNSHGSSFPNGGPGGANSFFGTSGQAPPGANYGAGYGGMGPGVGGFGSGSVLPGTSPMMPMTGFGNLGMDSEYLNPILH